MIQIVNAISFIDDIVDNIELCRKKNSYCLSGDYFDNLENFFVNIFDNADYPIYSVKNNNGNISSQLEDSLYDIYDFMDEFNYESDKDYYYMQKEDYVIFLGLITAFETLAKDKTDYYISLEKEQ